jgi:uncharacterized protein YecT (DUF1311 family)
VSADTLVYFGDLTEVCAAAYTALRDDGWFAFSLEAASGEGFELSTSGRYRHARAYVENILRTAGFATVELHADSLRKEVGQPVASWVVLARRASVTGSVGHPELAMASYRNVHPTSPGRSTAGVASWKSPTSRKNSKQCCLPQGPVMSRFAALCAWSCGLGLMVMVMGCGTATAATAATAMPAALQGHWQVVKVAVDEWDQPHWEYFPNDPRLLGRLLTIGGTGISLDDDSRTCGNPKFTVLPTEKLQHFIGKNYRRPPAYQMPPLPTLKNFGLHLHDVAVSPLQVSCTPENSPWMGSWFVLTDNRLLAGYGGDDWLLVLRRLVPHAPIRASFDCAKAESAVEKTICGSRTLAAYDRSVAAAYRGRLLRTDKPRAVIQQAQREWLKTRDACGADAACLEQNMRQRVDDLMQQW